MKRYSLHQLVVSAVIGALCLNVPVSRADDKPDYTLSTKAIEASLKPAEREATKLLIFTSVLSAKTKTKVIFTEPVKKNATASTRFVSASPALLLVGFAFKGFAEQSAKVFTTSFEKLTDLVRFLAGLVGKAAESTSENSTRLANFLDQSLKSLGIDKVLQLSSEKSSQAIQSTITALTPIVKSSVTKGFWIGTGTVVTGVSLGRISSFIWGEENKPLQERDVKSLLNDNPALDQEIAGNIEGLSPIFDLTADQQVRLKNAIVREMITQMIKHKKDRNFRANIDTLELMINKQIISKEQAGAAMGLRDLVRKSTQYPTIAKSDALTLVSSVHVISLLSAYLEEARRTQKLEPQDQAQILLMLESARTTLQNIKANLDSVPNAAPRG